MKRKGFTLVELLIVIAIMGALAATMTLSSTNATASADSAKIVNGLRAARTAAIMFFWDHPDLKDATTWTDVEAKFSDEIADYLDTDLGGTASAYILKLVGTNTDNKVAASKATWYVGYKIDTDSTPVTVQKRLGGQAKTYGLIGGTSTTTTTEGSSTTTVTIADPAPDYGYKATDTYNVIFVKVRNAI